MSQQQPVSANLAKWLKFISVTVISLSAFEVIAVATAMPYVVEKLGGEHLYALASGIVLATQLITTAVAGIWCDARGPKPVLYTGVALLVIGLTGATFAPNVEVLVLGRAFQGLGSGLIVVPLYVMIGYYIAPAQRPAFFAAFAAAWVLPSLIGPSIAGFFVQYLHWRWVFGITPILILLVLPFMVRKLAQFPDVTRAGSLAGVKRGAALATVSGVSVAGVQILSGATADGIDWRVACTALALTIASLTAMRALLPTGTFRAGRGVPATVLFRGLINGTYLAVELFLPLLLKNVHGFSPTRAGFVLTVGSVTWAIGSWIQGRVHEAAMRKKLPWIGSVAQLVGSAATLLALVPGLPGEIVFLGWLVASFGLGLMFPAMTVHALALTPRSEHGKTSAALQISDTLGAAIMIAYAGIIFAFSQPLGTLSFAVTIGFACVGMVLSVCVVPRISAEPSAEVLAEQSLDVIES